MTAGILLWVFLLTSGFFFLNSSMWDLVPWPRWNLGSLYWEHEFLATGAPGKSLMWVLKVFWIWWCACSPSALYQSVLPVFLLTCQCQYKYLHWSSWWLGYFCLDILRFELCNCAREKKLGFWLSPHLAPPLPLADLSIECALVFRSSRYCPVIKSHVLRANEVVI